MSTHYQTLSRPPADALREIKAGRLRGKTDISPQWRYEAMDATFGACGVGWKYEIERLWTEEGASGERIAFALVKAYTCADLGWSEPIPGIGGSMLIDKEIAGLHTNDEAYKMAVTDALSVALKMLGVGAEVYRGHWDGTKYINKSGVDTAHAPSPQPAQPPATQSPASSSAVISEPQRKRLYAIAKNAGHSDEELKAILEAYHYQHSKDILRTDYEMICDRLSQPASSDDEVPF